MNPFAKRVAEKSLELELMDEAIKEHVLDEVIQKPRPIRQLINRMFGGDGGVAHLPAAPVESKRISKRAFRRLRGKMKANRVIASYK